MYLRIRYGQLACARHNSASEHGTAVPPQHGTAPNHRRQAAEAFNDETPFHLTRWHCTAPQRCQHTRASLQDVTRQSADAATADRGKPGSSEVVFSIRLAWQWRGGRSSNTGGVMGPFPHAPYGTHTVILLLRSSTPSAELQAAVMDTRASGST